MPSARFILGPAGSGKTTRVVTEIAALLRADPLGEPIFLLVPDQATLLYERLAADASDTDGYVRLSVITFRQLVEMLLREGGGAAIPEITPLGRRILIGRLLRRLQPDLTFYRSSARQPGLANRLDEAFAELERSGASTDDLLFLAGDIEQQSPQSPLPNKLRDIRLLFTEYEVLLGSDRLDQHRRLTNALEAAHASTTLPRARLYVDAFYEFTRIERELLVAVAKAGCATTISLMLDPRDAGPAGRDTLLGEDHPFRAATHSYRRLHRALREGGVAVEEELLDAGPRFQGAPDLLHIQRQFNQSRPGRIGAAGDLRLIEAPSRRAEVDAAARQIIDWLATGLRQRDILVLARDVSDYQRHVEASFKEHRLDFFIDRQQPASHHPLIRTVRAAMQVALGQWHHGAVLELMKAGLVGFTDTEIDAVENYLLAHHIRGGQAWAQHWAFRLRRVDDDEAERFVHEETDRINGVREQLWAGMQPLLDCDDANACTAATWCRNLCASLDLLGVNAELVARVAAAEEAGDVEVAARHREVWSEFVELLDQLAAVLLDEALSLREFAEVIDVALERFVLAITPPTIDQVLVGSVERTRTGPVRACIVLGLSEGLFPRRQEESTALTDDDRRILDQRQIEMNVGSRASQFAEQFLAYVAFTRASERLVVTRCLADEEGRHVASSLFWTQLRSLYRDLPVEQSNCSPRARCIATPRQLVEASIDWHAQPAEAAIDASRQLGGYLQRSAVPDVVRLRQTVADARAYDNVATLRPDVAAALFASPLRTSATRLETFAACPFKHFAQHALHLAPREDTQVTQIDLGLVYHRVLEKLVRRAIRERHDLADPMPDLGARIEQFGQEAAGEMRDELMLSPGRSAHLMDGMRRTVADVVEHQRLSLSLGQFRPRHTEFAFGFEGAAPPLQILTPAGKGVEIRGKIDRVDMVELADRLAATVIDYKLGRRAPDFNRIYFGLSLQLVTYLLVLVSLGGTLGEAKPIAPAAAFYLRLLRRIESVAHPDEATEPPDEAFFLTGENKARGLIDEDFIDALDAVSTPFSKAYSIRRTQEPVETRRLDVLDHPTFESLVSWTRLKIGQLADQIMGGRISVEPYRLRTLTPCATCSYRSVCRLDTHFNDYRWLPPLGAERLGQIVREAADES